MEASPHFKNKNFKDSSFLHKFVVHIVFAVVSPLIFIYGCISNILGHGDLFGWNWTTRTEHERKVAGIQRQVLKWKQEGEGRLMASARPTWKSIAVTKADKSRYYRISLEGLDKVVELNESKKTIKVEPGITMGALSRLLIRRGLTIPVLPELDSLSVGGLICGTGIETSSHRYGLFHDTVKEYEIVMPNADVIVCSKDTDPDLYYSIPGSFATIGFLTAVTFPLIPAKKYVKLQYRKVSSIPEIQRILKEEPNHDFVEALAFSRNKIVLMLGDMTDQASSPSINRTNRWYKPFFFKQVEMKLEDPSTEFIPIVDYYHRHSKGIFWEIPNTLSFTNHWGFHYLLGWMLPMDIRSQCILPNFVYKSLSAGHIIQDYIVPFSKGQELFEKADEIIHIYPVWLCPVKIQETTAMYPRAEDGDYIDIGYYSIPQSETYHPVETQKQMEQLTIDLQGFQLLYAECYMKPEQFRKMYNTTTYDKVRKEWDCVKGFPDVYDKIGPKARNLRLKAV